uniref:Uncharacterized protein n=1 Tax=Cacopsylla melanoneura TaxID=428564 RepID=A0A8D9AQT3_9HEMI
MINRDGRGHSYCDVRGVILRSSQDLVIVLEPCIRFVIVGMKFSNCKRMAIWTTICSETRNNVDRIVQKMCHYPEINEKVYHNIGTHTRAMVIPARHIETSSQPR